MTFADNRLCHVSLGTLFDSPDTRIEQERSLAVTDLLECNTFNPVGHGGGPYRLGIETADRQLALHVTDNCGEHIVSHYLSLSPFRRLFKGYTDICESYHEAVRHHGLERVEVIDMGRRSVHNQGAELLRDRLSAKVKINNDTARRLFTLIYALLMRTGDHRALLSETAVRG